MEDLERIQRRILERIEFFLTLFLFFFFFRYDDAVTDATAEHLSDYYDRSLEARRDLLSAPSIHHLCFDAEVVWCQEEPMNMGAYSYIAPRLCPAMKSLDRGSADDIEYVGHLPSAATATGLISVHSKDRPSFCRRHCSQSQSHSHEPVGWCTLNIDGAAKGPLGLAGGGDIIRDVTS